MKNKLAEYVRIAAAGERVLISDRDRVVAELVPPAPGRGLTAERPGGSTLKQVLAGLDADAEVRLAGYPGSSMRDYLRPRASSQPAAASLGELFAGLAGGAVRDVIGQVARGHAGSAALLPGDWRF